MKTKRLVKIAIFAGLTAVMAQFRVDIGPVPITLQMLAVMLTGLLLNPRDAFFSQLVYLTMGVIGLPVYAGFRSGITVLFGPTGGYLVAFPLAAFLTASLRSKSGGTFRNTVAASVGLLPVYTLGWMVLSVYTKNAGKAFELGLIPFVWIDIFKAIVAGFIAKVVERYVPRLEKAEEMD